MDSDIQELNRLLKEKYKVSISDEELKGILEFYVEYIALLLGE